MASPYEPRIPPKIPDVAPNYDPAPYGRPPGRLLPGTIKEPPAPFSPFYPYPPHQSGGGIPVMAGQFIPPNGLAGWIQQTPAVQNLYRSRRANARRRRSQRGTPKGLRAVSITGRAKKVGRLRKRHAVKMPKARKGKRRLSGAAAKNPLVKGSAAAKRFMAMLRGMRKRSR